MFHNSHNFERSCSYLVQTMTLVETLSLLIMLPLLIWHHLRAQFLDKSCLVFDCYAARHHAAYLFIEGLTTSCNGLIMFLLSKLRFWHKICVSSSNSSSCLLGNNFDNVLAGTLVLSPKHLSATCTNYTLVLAIVKIHRPIVIGNGLYFLSSDSERRGLNSVLFVP